MTDEYQQDEATATGIPDMSPTQQVSLVLEDVRALVRAELGYYRARLDYSRQVIRRAFRFGAIAALAFSGAAIALVIGLIMTLAPRIGPGWATLLVTLGFIIIGAIAGYQARKWVRKIYFPEIERNDDDIPEGSQGDKA